MPGDRRLLIVDCRSKTRDRRSITNDRHPQSSISNQRSTISNPSHGFTLLEVILTLSLTVLLMAALYGSLKLHLTMAQKGPEGVRRAQAGRGVLHRIASDLRATVPPIPTTDTSTTSGSGGSTAPSSSTTSSSTTSSSSPSSSSNSSASIASSTTEPDFYSAAYGIVGGTDRLDIYVSQHRANLDDSELASSAGSIAQASNVLRVSYSLISLGTRRTKAGVSSRWGIARTQVASIAAQQLDAASDDADFRAATHILWDNVGQLQFQYWDDSTGSWVDSWGSDAPIAPPRAVKVFISLLPPEEYQADQFGLTGGQSTWSPNYQLVIAIPTWDADAGALDGGG